MKLFITICAVLATSTALPNQFTDYFKNSTAAAGCSNFCQRSLPDKNVSLGDYIPESTVTLSIGQLCASLQTENPSRRALPNFMRFDYLRSRSIRDLPSLSSGNVCAFLYAEAFDNAFEPEGNMQILLDKLQHLSLEVICELFPASPPLEIQNQSKPIDDSAWNYKCSEVCFTEHSEDARLYGAFLEDLRAQSLRKACKGILLSGLVGMSRGANESVVYSSYDAQFLAKKVNTIEKYVEIIKEKKSDIETEKNYTQEAYEAALNFMAGDVTQEEVKEALAAIAGADAELSLYRAALGATGAALENAILDMRRNLQYLNLAFEKVEEVKELAQLKNNLVQSATANLLGME